MAIMSTKSNMVFWEIKIGAVNMTDVLAKFVSSIKITDKIFPTNSVGTAHKDDPENNTPSNARISITSNDYIEGFFIEGMPIDISIGYNRFPLEPVFRGKVARLPDGIAKEMLDYEVTAISNEMTVAYEQKNRIFQPTTKAAIIAQIASDHGLIPLINIRDTRIINIQNQPMQNGVTDLELLLRFADQWSCLCWFVAPNYLYFQDSDSGHTVGGFSSIGYRTDSPLSESNIESISWKHRPTRAGTASNSGVIALNEDGRVPTDADGRIIALGYTWELAPQYADEAKNSPSKFFKYSCLVGQATLIGEAEGERALKKYYVRGPGGDRTSRDAIPPHADSGFEFDITLNEGDPSLKPPRKIRLYAGTTNTRVSTSKLPNWIFRHSPNKKSPAFLNLNQSELHYSDGRLKQRLSCTMSGSS